MLHILKCSFCLLIVKTFVLFLFPTRWVSEKTKGKINEIIEDSLPASTKAVIASALYFKALCILLRFLSICWFNNVIISFKGEKTFMEGGTSQKDFYPDGFDRPPIQVDMMATGGSYPFYDSKESDCRIIGMPYRKHLTTMYIIMPNNSTRHRLRQFQATLTADKIQNMIEKMEWRTAIILFPKLHITNRVDLRKILSRMGLRSLFSYEQSDLSLISSGVEMATNFVTNNQRFAGAMSSEENSQFLFTRIGGDRRNATNAVRNNLTKRGRRSMIDPSLNLKRLDLLRSRLNSEHAENPRLFADELIHQVDLTVNEGICPLLPG